MLTDYSNKGATIEVQSTDTSKQAHKGNRIQVPMCHSDEAEQAIKNALENASDTITKIRLLKFIDAIETYYSNDGDEKRECLGRFLLNICLINRGCHP